MKFTNLKSAHYTSPKFEGTREFYVVADQNDLKKLMEEFPKLKSSWRLIRLRISEIISNNYVALVTDIKPKANCVEVTYENRIAHKCTYNNAYHRVF